MPAHAGLLILILLLLLLFICNFKLQPLIIQRSYMGPYFKATRLGKMCRFENWSNAHKTDDQCWCPLKHKMYLYLSQVIISYRAEAGR